MCVYFKFVSIKDVLTFFRLYGVCNGMYFEKVHNHRTLLCILQDVAFFIPEGQGLRELLLRVHVQRTTGRWLNVTACNGDLWDYCPKKNGAKMGQYRPNWNKGAVPA